MKICLLLIFLFVLAGCAAQPEDLQYIPDNYADDDYNYFPVLLPEGLEVYVFGLRSADAVLITTENYVVLIDTGERQHGRSISDQMFYREIFHIDYLIITHFDRDHVGGAYDILRFQEVRNIIVPNYHRISNSANRFREAKQRVGLEAYVLTETITLALDDAVFEIMPSGLEFFVFGHEDDGDEDPDAPRENDFSIMVSVTHGENSFLFAGDAMAGRLSEFSEQDISHYDFVKLPHHGRHNRQTAEFLNAINPRYAVSTCCEERPIDPRVAEILQSFGTEIFLTVNGGVSVRSDGYNLMVVQTRRG